MTNITEVVTDTWYPQLVSRQTFALSLPLIPTKALKSVFPVLLAVFSYRWPGLPSSSLPSSDPTGSTWAAPAGRPPPCAEDHPELSQPLGPRREAHTKRRFLPRTPEISVSIRNQLADSFEMKKHAVSATQAIKLCRLTNQVSGHLTQWNAPHRLFRSKGSRGWLTRISLSDTQSHGRLLKNSLEKKGS